MLMAMYSSRIVKMNKYILTSRFVCIEYKRDRDIYEQQNKRKFINSRSIYHSTSLSLCVIKKGITRVTPYSSVHQFVCFFYNQKQRV